MTRPETLVRQLAAAYDAPLLAEELKLRRAPAPKFPETPAARAAWRHYRASAKQTDRLRKRLEALHAHHYSSNGWLRMNEDTGARQRAYVSITAKRQQIGTLKQTAMLAVLGLDAAKARPIVLKLKKDLERVGK